MGADTARHYQWYPFFNLGHWGISRAGNRELTAEFMNYWRQGLEAVYQRGMAYHYLKRYHDAYNQFLRAENLAKDGKQKADAIYQQAKTATTGKLDGFARTSWRNLLKLPEGDVLPIWIQEANFYLYPCKGDQCLALTATAEAKGTAAP